MRFWRYGVRDAAQHIAGPKPLPDSWCYGLFATAIGKRWATTREYLRPMAAIARTHRRLCGSGCPEIPQTHTAIIRALKFGLCRKIYGWNGGETPPPGEKSRKRDCP